MRNFKTGLIVLLIILIMIWLQLNLFNAIPFYGVKANVGLVVVVTLSILCGQEVGSAVGITYGILADILFGKAFGVYTLLFFGVGYFCGLMSKSFSKDNKVAIILITAGITAAFEGISYILFVLFYHYEIEIWAMIKIIVLEVLYNMFLARLFFHILSNLSEIINKGKRSYYLL